MVAKGCSFEDAEAVATRLESSGLEESCGLKCKAERSGSSAKVVVFLPVPVVPLLDPLPRVLFVRTIEADSPLIGKLQVGELIESVSACGTNCTAKKCSEIASFLQQNANNQRSLTVRRVQNCTALHLAVLNKQFDAAKLLVSLGAKTDIPMKGGRTVDDLIKMEEQALQADTICYTDKDGDRIAFVVEGGKLIKYVNDTRSVGGSDDGGVITELRYKPGQPADVRDQHGWGSNDFRLDDLMKLKVMADGVDVPNNLPDTGADEMKRAIEAGRKKIGQDLRALTSKGELLVIKARVRAGKNPDADASETGSTALMLAAACGNTEVIRFLVEKGADINLQDDKTDKGQKCTALHLAVLNKQVDAAKLLASLGAKTDIPMRDGRTVETLVEEAQRALDQLTCTRGHSLEVTLPGQKPAGYTSTVCDTCGARRLQNNGKPNFHRSACQYDICFSCAGPNAKAYLMKSAIDDGKEQNA